MSEKKYVPFTSEEEVMEFADVMYEHVMSDEIELPADYFDRFAEAVEKGGMPEKMKQLLARDPEWADMRKYKAEEYTYRVFWSVEDNAWIGICEEFKSLSNIDESNQTGAFLGIVDLIGDTLDEMYSEGDQPPAPAWSKSDAGD